MSYMGFPDKAAYDAFVAQSNAGTLQAPPDTGNVGSTPEAQASLAESATPTQYDPAKDLYYHTKADGTKDYIAPNIVANPGGGYTTGGKGTGFGKLTPQGGGAIRSSAQWNGSTGTYDNGLDAGKLISYALMAGFGGEGIAGLNGLASTAAPTAAAPTATGTGAAATTGAAGTTAATAGGTGAAAGGGTAASTLAGASTIGKLISNIRGSGSDLSSLLGSAANTAQGNRIVQGDFTQAYDKNMLQAQLDRDTVESDALKKLAITKYLSNGGSHFTPPTIQLNGQTRTAPNLGFGPTPASDAQKQGAASLQGQLTSRLAPGGTYMPQPLSSYATAGTGENLLTGGSAAGAFLTSLLKGNGLSGQTSGASTPDYGVGAGTGPDTNDPGFDWNNYLSGIDPNQSGLA